MACGGNEQDRSSIRGWGCDATGVCRNRFARGFLVRAGSHAVDPARTNHHPLSRAAHLAAKRSHRRSPAYFFASARRSKTRSLRACWVHKPSRNGISFCDLPPSHFASGAFGREAISPAEPPRTSPLPPAGARQDRFGTCLVHRPSRNGHTLSRAAHLAAKRSHRRSPAYFPSSVRRSRTRLLRACWVHRPSRNGISFRGTSRVPALCREAIH